MFSIEINASKRLLVVTVAGHVSEEEVKHAAEQVREALRGAAPGIRVLTDFRWLESMRPGAAPHISEIMEALAEKQVASVIRIIPEPGKDIGMINILSQFHYSRELTISTVETLVDALDRLSEQTAERDRKELEAPSNQQQSTDSPAGPTPQLSIVSADESQPQNAKEAATHSCKNIVRKVMFAAVS